ncbi:DUF3280 domain-containing protein [Caldimonas tepidiphila]|uniref:DUF3280 domain-containing protein n=1 Tax=Caldimonas tepidiphila TaxID=2315841 RepID=UPI000E5AD3CA|nr:DUF3280 domain-containing protein [Caldimonas tepidiphila]
MHRRLPLTLMLGLALLPSLALPQALRAQRSLAVLDFDLIEEHPNPAGHAALRRRLLAAHAQLQQELRERELYRVLDLAPAQELLGSLRGQQEHLHRCNGCAQQLGQRLGAELVMATWVQKVSELILNINLEIHEVTTERVVLTKSVDLRGNTDQSWQRGIRYLVRDIAEKRERNPAYGL